MIDEIQHLCRDLSPPDVERAVKFNEVARDESIISYKLFLEKGIVPRKVFIDGYNAMYAAAALFLAKKFKVKLDETIGSSHKNMRKVLDFYTKDQDQNQKLIALYEIAIEKFQILSQQYNTKHKFADKVIKDLMSEGFHQGKKVTYYNENIAPNRKDPLSLVPEDAKIFVDTIVEPFLYILGEITND